MKLMKNAIVMACALVGSSAQELPPFKIVHLGDSYSAGNGARDEFGGRNYVGVRGCYRSPTNWGQQFADSLRDVFSVTYINKACSGAQLPQLMGPQRQDLDLKTITGDCPAPDYPGDEYYQDDEGDFPTFCRRYIFPQINAVDESVNLVIMTFGGNDLGFGNIVRECFVIGLRDVESCRTLIEAAQTALEDLTSRTADALTSIAERLDPNANVVLVSYPYLLLDIEYTLEEGDNVINVREELRAVQDAGDLAQREAVAAANARAGRDFALYYDGTKTLFGDHEPHPSVLIENDDRWIWEFDGLSIPEWYHFNAQGHSQLGEALSSFFSILDVTPGTFEDGGNIDMAFVVDTTGSMSAEIAAVRTNLADIVAQLAAATSSYRVAVVSYKDFPEFCPGNYPSRVDQDFTNNLSLIQAGIDSLVASGGCDGPETVYSGIKAALDLTWTSGATKIMIVIGDAPAKIDSAGAEPISGITASQLVAESIALDPVAVTGANVGGLDVDEISAATGGSVIAGGNVVDTISEVIAETAGSPFAWIGAFYSGKVGSPITFDASGSYDSEGIGLSLYEWSFFGDGTYDLSTTEPQATYTYDSEFTGIVLVRVTSQSGRRALGSAAITVNTEGSVPQGDEEPCEVGVDGIPILLGEDGIVLSCTPALPTSDKEGLKENLGDGGGGDCFLSGFFLDFLLCGAFDFFQTLIAWIQSLFPF